MFCDAEHLDTACHILDIVNELLQRRHIAIFHRHPYRRAIALLERLNTREICRVCIKRFFHQNRQGHMFGNLFKLAYMTVIGAYNQQAIKRLMRQ